MSVLQASAAPAKMLGPLSTGTAADVPGEASVKNNGLKSEMPASPLQSAEAFEGYCSQVQARLAEHAAQRTHFLQTAYERLTRLLHTARAVEDTSLYNELWQHRVAVRELLDALTQFSSSPRSAPSDVSRPDAPSPASPSPLPASSGASAPAVPPLSASGSETGLPFQPGPPMGAKPADSSAATLSASGMASSPAAAPASTAPLSSPRNLNGLNGVNGHGMHPEPMPAEEPSSFLGGLMENRQTPPAEPAPRPVRHPVRPLSDIEADATRLRESLRGWSTRYPLRDPADKSTGMNGLHVPNCLRLRAVACRMRRLEEEAGDTEVLEATELGHDIEDLLDDAGDEEYTVALDYDIEPLPTAYQWGELAERYEETARAEEAFGWWIANRATLSVADVQNLAESVAAIQQRFNRLLFRIGARDPFQQQLFDDLRGWAKEAQCYLHSLRPKVPIAELIEKAQTIDEAWEQAREPLRAQEGRQKAVEDVIQMVSASDFGEKEAEDEQQLQAALLHCRELRIPYSDRNLRDALLPWAAFLEGDERFKELLREITLEWERRQEAGKAETLEEEPSGALEELRMELEAVRQVTQGKRCLLLGGTCREENRRKIEEALQLSELVWPSTKPSDPLSKFDTEIRHADIVALLTRFSRKEWKNAQDICAREGKKFVHLTTGYGVAQVARHFYTQIAPQGVAH